MVWNICKLNNKNDNNQRFNCNLWLYKWRKTGNRHWRIKKNEKKGRGRVRFGVNIENYINEERYGRWYTWGTDECNRECEIINERVNDNNISIQSDKALCSDKNLTKKTEMSQQYKNHEVMCIKDGMLEGCLRILDRAMDGDQVVRTDFGVSIETLHWNSTLYSLSTLIIIRSNIRRRISTLWMHQNYRFGSDEKSFTGIATTWSLINENEKYLLLVYQVTNEMIHYCTLEKYVIMIIWICGKV